MVYNFSTKISSLQASAIREILKCTNDPSVISFAAGSPASEAFPIETFQKLSQEILTETPVLALQYNITEGYAPLREKVKERLISMDCFNPETDDLAITSGAQQGIELVAKVLCDPGETVICEAPSFVGSLNSFRSYGGKLLGITMEDDGVDLNELENAMKTSSAKLMYIIPNFQNPTGRTTSFEKRKKIYELAKKYNVVILEDNPYGDLRFAGENVPSIKTLDKDGVVVYAGTFSKILAPGLRVGYIAGPKEIIQKCVVCKQASDVHTNIWAQVLCTHFLETINLDDHLAKLRKIYKRKAELMLNGMKENFSDKLTWSKPEGGMFIWATLPDGCNADDFCKKSIDKYKIAAVPGSAFSVNDEKSSSFRLNFSAPSDENIKKGIELLGKLTKEISE